MGERGAALALLAAALLPLPLLAEAARIEGRIVHAERPEAVARLRVDLFGLLQGAEEGLERTTLSDREGRYAFDGLPEAAVYLVMATYREVRFPGGRAIFEEGSPATQTLDVRIYERSGDPREVAIADLDWTVERLDAGTFRIEQRARIRNPRPEAIVADAHAPPILRVALAFGHRELVSPFGGVPAGFEVRNGVLELRGPVLPGERDVVFGYEVDAGGPELATEIRFPDPVGSFTLHVRDAGVRIQAGDLHPARPARDDRGAVYQRYLGFDVAAGTRVPLRVASLPPRGGSGAASLALAAGALTLLVSLFVFGPLAAAPRRAGDAASTEPPSPARAALVAALRELEHDFETGKLSPADRDRLRQELVREAAEELERAGRG